MIRITALLRNCFHGQVSYLRSAGASQKQPMCKPGRRKRRSKNEPVLMVYRVPKISILNKKLYLLYLYDFTPNFNINKTVLNIISQFRTVTLIFNHITILIINSEIRPIVPSLRWVISSPECCS